MTRSGLYACCRMHSTILGGKVGAPCPYCSEVLYESDSLGAPIRGDPFDFSRLPDYRDPMFDFVEDVKIFVEIGSQRGFTAWRAVKHLPNATIHCIDPWRNYGGMPASIGDLNLGWEIFKKLHADNIQSGRVVPHFGFSWDIAPGFNEPIDFLWIDGDHTFEGVQKDLSMWVPKVRSGGVVVGDNYEINDVRRAVCHWFHGSNMLLELNVGHALAKKTKRQQFWFWKE